jgi:hypothetical protein
MLAVLEKRHPDRIPWVPRLELWYEAARRTGSLPERYRGLSLRDIERDLGVGTPAREGRIVVEQLRGVEVNVEQSDGGTLTRYVTPVGSVSTRWQQPELLARVGIAGRETEPMIKGPEDYRVAEYIVEHTEMTPDYAAYVQYEEEVGEDGVPLVALGDCPMGLVMRHYIGWGRAHLELHDHRTEVERLCQVLAEQMRERVKLAAASPARLFLLGVHFDCQMIPPSLFREHFVPHCQEFAQALHSAGKLMACHADADASLLLPSIEDAGYDMAECFVTAPMVPCTLAQARRAWGDRVIIWGGIPSVILCEPYDDAYFEGYMLEILATIAPGDAFVLGVADNVMPEADIDRVARVTEIVEASGSYPIG